MAAVDGESESASKITSLKIHVENDLQLEEGEIHESSVSTDESEMEVGEGSEDELEVNVIVGTGQSIQQHRQLVEEKLHLLREQKDYDYTEGHFTEAITSGKVEFLRHISPENLRNLYRSLNLVEKDFYSGGWRSNAIHLRGIKGLTSDDLTDYFGEYTPSNIEWLCDDACNVVWNNNDDPIDALLNLSCPIKPVSETVKKEKSPSPKLLKSKIVKCTDTVPKTSPEKPIQNSGEAELDESLSASSSSSGQSSSSGSSEESSSSDSDEDPSGSATSGSSSGDSSSSDNESGSKSSSSSSSDDSSSDSSDSDSEDGHKNEDNNNQVPENKPVPAAPAAPSSALLPREPEKVVTEEEGVTYADVGISIPPGRWRLGVPCPGIKALLMRFAHCKDKKIPGIQNPVEIIGIKDKRIRSPKRSRSSRHEREKPKIRSYLAPRVYDHPPYLKEWRRNAFLDANPNEGYRDLDNPMQQQAKNPWGFLAQNWGKTETQDSIDYQLLLRQHITASGQKRSRQESSEEEESYDSFEDDRDHSRRSFGRQHRKRSRHDDDSFKYRSRVHRSTDDDQHMTDGSDDVVSWRSRTKLPRMRMYADAEEKRKKRQKKSHSVHSRLEGRLKKPGQSRIKSQLADSDFVSSVKRSFRRTGIIDLREKLEKKRNK